MLSSEDKLKIESMSELTPSLAASFMMLYQPLIGKDAAILYQVLLSIYTRKANIRNHLLIQKLCGMSMERVEKNRHILEQFLLLKTYYQGSKNMYIYQLFMPMEGSAFLRHEVFGRLYMREMGNQIYEFNKLCFTTDYTQKEEYEEITVPFENILKSTWEEEQEEQFNILKPDGASLQESTIPLAFNFDRFLSGFSPLVFPRSERTEKNLRFIAEMATIHGIKEEDMRKLVAQSMNLKRNILDHEILKKKARNAKTSYEVKETNAYLLPPVRFLQQKQHGIEVTNSDKRLIEVLMKEYKLQADVVNVLLEYVLEKTNQRLTKAYVEKVAGMWIRLQIDSHEKALQLIEDEKNKPKSVSSKKVIELPEWFQHEEKPKDEVSERRKNFDQKAFLEKMRKLRGE